MAVQPFVLLTTARSGSNWLLTLLNQHPNVAAFFEVLHNNPEERSPVMDTATGKRTRRCSAEEDGATFLAEAVYDYPYSRRVRCAGIKLFYSHALEGPTASAWDYLRNLPDLRVVHLEREGLLESFVSRQRALRTRTWVVDKGTDDVPPDPGPETVDAAEFVKYVDRIARERATAVERLDSAPMLSVRYEEMREHRNREIKRILRFLGVRAWPYVHLLKDRTVVQARRPLHERVANYEALRSALEDTPYATYTPAP